MADLPSRSSIFCQNDDARHSQRPLSHEVSSPQRSYSCQLCSASFRRREHFERHLKSHSKSKEFRCDICNKQFARRDTLQRHSTIHGQVSTKVQKTPPRALRACLNCVKSKQRCSGSHPCDRCNRKDWPCHFNKWPKDATVQETDTLPDSTEETLSSGMDRNSRQDIASKTHPAHVFSPISSIYANSIGSNRLTDGVEPYTDVPLPTQTEHIPQYGDPTSLFDSYLLWHLNDPFEHPHGDSIDFSGLPTPSGLADTSNKATGMSLTTSVDVLGYSDGAPSSHGRSRRYLSADSLTQDDRDILISEDYGHVIKPSISTYEQMCAHYAEVSRSAPDAALPTLYPLEILHVCTQLYFEHFHPGFPILHQPSFQAESSSWLLYIAVAAVGSQYSQLAGRNELFFDLVKTIRLSLLGTLESPLSVQNNLQLAQATLLLNFALLFGGTRDNLMHLQYQRNLLVTMCRPLLVPGILFAKNTTLSASNMQIGDWAGWITTESWKRLVYFAWLNECFQLVLFDLPPLFTVDEIHLSMPCNDELWQCSNSHHWEMAKGLQGECPTLASLLKMELIESESIRSLGDSALWISVCALYFTERYSTPPHLFYSCPDMHRISAGWREHSSQASMACNRNDDPLDSILTSFQKAVTENRQDCLLSLATKKFSLTFRFLRFVKYRFLYVSSGWMAQPHEVNTAAQQIAQLLKSKPRQARQALLHAAQLFRIIRSQRQSDFYDAFFLLMATLYIWNFDRFMTLDDTRALLTREGATHQIIRMDQERNDDLQEQWIAGTGEIHRMVHISGVGVLNGQDSVTRILRESVRILNHQKAWSGHAHAIKNSLLQILSGATPSFPPEAD